MAATAQVERPEEVASKVMRRVQVAKMTRTLQDRLALANVKIQNGWENLSLDAIEPQVNERLRRKRPAPSNNDTISDSASTTSSRLHSSNGLASSPITEPLFSEDLPRSGGSYRNKRIKPSDGQTFAASGAATGRRTRGAAARQDTWKKSEGLAQSSPIKPVKHARFPSNQPSHLSFISEGSNIADDDPPSPNSSEDDDADLPITSFSINQSTRVTSSPPRTPPPEGRMRRINQVSWSRTPKSGDDGADLLMYLAASPSPAIGAASNAKTVIQPPSTPPCKSTPLPSSHMTPGTSGNGFLGFGPTTPGMNFAFSDFINVTPSPAQGPWSRTPVAGRTPGASARRRLDFNSLAPPTSSPTMTRNSRNEGLGMELGGELRT